MRAHLRSLVSTDNGGKIAEPLERGESGECVAERLEGTSANHLLLSFLNVLQRDTIRALVIFLRGIKRGFGGIDNVIGGTTSKATEDCEDDVFRNDDIVVGKSPLEVEELHADRLSCKDVDEAVGGDTILSDESFKDMETLWCDLEYCAVFE